MIGIIIHYQGKTVVATGPTQGYCEEIALQLFLEDGLDLDGVELPIVVFDPLMNGGVLMDPSEPESMKGWSMEGWQSPR